MAMYPLDWFGSRFSLPSTRAALLERNVPPQYCYVARSVVHVVRINGFVLCGERCIRFAQ